MTDRSRPTDDRLAEAIVAKREGLHFETKRMSNRAVAKALETVSAFANTEGGVLALGVEDFDKARGRDRLYGIEDNPEAVDELQRKLRTHFAPPIEGVRLSSLHVTLRDGSQGRIALLQVPQSAKVHSIVDNGTWLRLPSSNREMQAAEITELMFRRGVVSAESEALDIPLSVIETDNWAAYCAARRLGAGDVGKKLLAIGLGKQVGEGSAGRVWPTKAAVLLFAEFPSDVLAAHGARAGIRVLHYSGTAVEHGPDPNLKKPPQSVTGPVVPLINRALVYVKNEIAQGFKMAASGFEGAHVYPERVIKEAITNAVLHRDYRYPKDVLIRIFDTRIEVESPGELPANITPATIMTAGSAPRNPSLVNGAREFPRPPNVDVGEGVPMMFAEMRAKGLYPPQYAVNRDAAVPSVTVTLLNEQRPPVWEQVSDWIDRHGYVANRDLRQIAGVDTLDASRMLKGWVERGLLLADDTKGKRGTVYRKPTRAPADTASLFSETDDNNSGEDENIL
jgi:ATP-dependent DNA helicase RecG